METKEIKIQVPEGYEIDKELSSFEKIVFKKKEDTINSWEDLKEINGYVIDMDTSIENCSNLNAVETNKNVFLNEKYVKSAVALAQISQLLPYYDSNVDWGSPTIKYCIIRNGGKIIIEKWQHFYYLLAFSSNEEAERFLKHNEQLVKDYFML